MGKRVGVLAAVLVFRLALGGLLTAKCHDGQRVRVAGIVSRVEQSGSNSIISVGQFRLENSGKLDYFRGQNVAVFGKCRREVIDFFLNRIWLIEPQIEVGEKKLVAEREWWMKGELLQERLIEVYKKTLPEPEASLVAGIVLGAKSNLPERFYQALVDTGTVHIVVASGYNLSVIGEVLFYILIYFVSRKWATWLAILGMVGYTWMAGFGIPVVRALIMGSLVLISRVKGRVEETGWWLALAVFGMLMWSPELVESVSFQLSVAATAGLIFVEPFLSTKIRINEGTNLGRRITNVLARTELAPTLSAQIMTAPLIWWHFGRLSLVSPLVNLLVLPLVPPVMLLGALQLVLGWVIAPFSYGLLHLIVVIIKFFGG